MAALDELDAPPANPYGNSFFDQPAPADIPFGPTTRRDIARQTRQNAIRADDLSTRGIPTFKDEQGNVQALTDESGGALSSYDPHNEIAYDASGKPVSLNRAVKGKPVTSDPFAAMEPVTDPRTGIISKSGRGLYQYEGEDPEIVAAHLQKAKDKEIRSTAALLGRKLTLDEHDLTTGEKDHKAMRESLQQAVPTLLDPKFEGADLPKVLSGIQSHFDAQYATPEANATSGWFSKELSPEAVQLRTEIDAKKADAIDKAKELFALKDSLSTLSDSVDQTRAAEKAGIETLLAHKMGVAGPGDTGAAGEAAQAAPGLYPPEADRARMLGGQPLRGASAFDDTGAPPSKKTSLYPPEDQWQRMLGDSPAAIDAKKAYAAGEQNKALLGIFMSPFGMEVGHATLPDGRVAVHPGEPEKGIETAVKTGAVSKEDAAAHGPEVVETTKASQELSAGNPQADGTQPPIYTVKGMEATLARVALKTASGFDQGVEGLTRYLNTAAIGMLGKGVHPEAKNPLTNFADYLKNRVAEQQRVLAGGVTEGEKLSPESAKGVSGVAAEVAGGLGAAAPGLAAGGIPGLMMLAMQAIGGSSAAARTKTLNEGGTKAEADKAGWIASAKTLPTLGLYALAGPVAGKIVKSIVPVGASPFFRAALTFATQAPMNMVASSGGKLIVGEDPKPTMDSLVTDATFAALGSRDAYAHGKDVKIAQTMMTGEHPEMVVMNGIANSKSGEFPKEMKNLAQIYANRMRAIAEDFLTKSGEKIPTKIDIPEPGQAPKFAPGAAKEKPVKGKEVPPTKPEEPPTAPEPPAPKPKPKGPAPAGAPAAPEPTGPSVAEAEKAFVEQGGHADRLEGQNKLAALRQKYPKDADLIAAINEHLGRPVEPSAPTAPEPPAPKPKPKAPVAPAGPEKDITGTGASITAAEKAFVEQGGHADKLDAQNKLAALRKKYPDEAQRIAAINEHLGPAAETPPAKPTAPPTKVQPGEFPKPGYTAQEPKPPKAPATVDEAAHGAATSPKNKLPHPSPEQMVAGNYQKGHETIGGHPVTFENPAGSHRSNVHTVLQTLERHSADPGVKELLERARQTLKQNGPRATMIQVANAPGIRSLAGVSDAIKSGWVQRLTSHYGYLPGTKGADKDHVDAFVRPGTKVDYAGPVFVINQYNKDGSFDEHKVIIGVKDEASALAEYNKNYEPGWNRGKSVVRFDSLTDLKAADFTKGPLKPAPTAAAPVKQVTPEGGQPHQPQTTGAHVIATAIQEPGTVGYLVGDRWNEEHDSIGIRHDLDEVPQKWRGFLVQEANGQQKFATRAEAGPIAEKAGQLANPIGEKGLQSTDLKAIEKGGEPATAKQPTKPAEQEAPGAKGAAEQTGPKPGGHGLAGKPLGGAGAPAERHTEQQAAAELDKALKFHAPVITALGLKTKELPEGPKNKGALCIANRDGKWILGYNLKIVAETLDLVVAHGRGTPEEFMKAGVEEETLHFRDVTVTGRGNFDRVHDLIWNSLTPPTRGAVRKTYLSIKNPRILAAEYLRMVQQFRDSGRITESLHRDVTRVMPFLEGKQSDAVEAHLKRMVDLTAPAPAPAPAPPAPPKETELFKRARALNERLALLKDASSVDLTVIRTLIKAGNGKALDQAEAKIAKLERAPEPKSAYPQVEDPYGGKHTIYGWATDIRKTGDTPTGFTIGGSGWEWYALSPIKGDIVEKGFVHGFEDEFGSFSISELKANGIRFITDPKELAKIDPPIGWKKTGGPEDATTTGLKPKGDKPEHIGDAPRKDVPTHEEEVRGEKGPPAGDRGEPGERPPAPEEKPAGRPPPAVLDEQAGKALDDALEGLFADLPAGDQEQKTPPPEKIPALVTAAAELIRSGVDTPAKLAAVLEERFKGKARPYSQTIADMMTPWAPGMRGQHDWKAIYAALQRPIKPQNATQLTQAVAAALKVGQLPRRELTDLASETGLSVKEVDEAAEVAVVQVAREIAQSMGSPEERFDRMVELYDRQPNLTAKTSTSKVDQAYSTPAPLAFAASHIADMIASDPRGRTLWEPTAGNGMLLIQAKPHMTLANELNPDRAAALKAQGFGVTTEDATTYSPGTKVERVLANPPFGTIIDDNQQKKEWQLVGTGDTTKQIDQAITYESLSALKDDGRAVLILGGKNIVDPVERMGAYATPDQIKFWQPLYEKYNVVDHFTVSGDLYKKQGAGWPVDVIVIAGRGKSQIELPSASSPRILNSWNDLRAELSRTDAERIDAGKSTAAKIREQLGDVFGGIRGVVGGQPAPGPVQHPKPAVLGDAGGGSVSGTLPSVEGQQPPVVSGGATSGSVTPAPEGASGLGFTGSGGASEQSRQQLEESLAPSALTDTGGFRVPYVPQSKADSFGIYIPSNMATPAAEALKRLEQEVGSLDEYVRTKLGYSKDAPIKQYFAAEQIDAIALGVYAIEHGTAMILGDQGGIGKGRVGAGMLVYFHHIGKIPIFMTKDEKLYAAMIEDLFDIGRPDIVPIMTNSTIKFEDFQEKIWQQKAKPVAAMLRAIADTGKLPMGIGTLFSTYSQVQSDEPADYNPSKAQRAADHNARRPPPDGLRMNALKAIIKNSGIVLDESHLAAGDSIRAWRINPLLHEAHGVMYMSATFAKRPDSMGIYGMTSLNRATQSMDELVDAMRQGGVPLQNVICATLTHDGLYLRRERDFSKAVFRSMINLDTKDRDVRLADNYTEGIRSILDISNKLKDATVKLNAILAKLGKNLHVNHAPRLESVNFASKVHNLISQYLFAIKTESVIQRAIEGIKVGFPNEAQVAAQKRGEDPGKLTPHKVVITFFNTMEAPILDLENSKRSLDFTGMLLHYLDSMRVITSGGRGPNPQSIVISDDPAEEFANLNDQQLQARMVDQTHLDPATGETSFTINEPAVMEYFRRLVSPIFIAAEEKIDVLDLADMPLSPIDYMKRKLTEAGIRTGEMTGRKAGIDETGAIYKIPASANNKQAQLRTMKQFNNSDMDALLINGSGSTGISLHSSVKFERKDPRGMLVAQMIPDINDQIQFFYRIDRTGQVHQPYYEMIQTGLTVEFRPAAIFAKKMMGLNANTTSNAENEISQGSAGVDIFNQYGDEVVHDYLRNDRQFLDLLNQKKWVDTNGNLLPLNDVTSLYEHDGQFAQAVTGRAGILPDEITSAFWEKVMSDYVAKIKYLNQMGQNELVSDTMDIKATVLEQKELTPAKPSPPGLPPSEFDGPSYLQKIKAIIGTPPASAKEVTAMIQEIEPEKANIIANWLATAAEWKVKKLAHLAEKVLTWDEEKAANWEAKWVAQQEEIHSALNLIGYGLHLKDTKDLDGYGAITAVHIDKDNPLTPSAQRFEVHINSTKRKISVPGSQIAAISSIAAGDFESLYEATAERSNERYMITGNLLAAYLAIKDAAPTAKIVNYTTDKGELRHGILMPGVFTPGSLSAKRPVESASHMRTLLEAGRALQNAGGEVTIVMRQHGDYVLRVPSSRTMGGAYWRDRQLAELMGGGQFIERGGAMVGHFNNGTLPGVHRRLEDLGAILYYQDTTELGTDPTELGAMRPVRAVVATANDVATIAKEIGMTAKESLHLLQHLVSPTHGVAMDAHDQVMRMLGERNQKAYETDRVLEAYRVMFDKMPRAEQIDFIDRMKTGDRQKTPELQIVADVMRRIDTESWEAARTAYLGLGFKDKDLPLSWLENHYRVLWKKIPGRNDKEKSAWIGRSRRGLRGSMGQHKQHSLETMSEGLDEGGVPYSYNPVVMFKLAQVDLWKLTSTLKTWKWGKDNNFVHFVKGPFPKLPDGMVWLNDAIARVYFPASSGEGLVAAGRYAVEEGFGRLLNNYLSTDYIRQVRLGRGLLWLKNATTTLELSLSAFHAIFETLEAVGSNIGLGLSKLVNRGLLRGNLGAAASGMKDIILSPVSPASGFLLGRQIRLAAANPSAYFKTAAGKRMMKSYPRAREMLDDLFTGGWKPPELEQDWKNNSIRTFVESLADLKSGTSDNYVGAGLRAFPAANEFLMKPLFDHYIPNLKVAQFFKEYGEAIEQNERKLKGGVLTRAALARQIWRLVEDRFGELNYDTLFWNANFKTAMQLMFRSVTWKLGSVEAFGGAFKGQAKEFKDAFRDRRAPELHRNMAWIFGMFLLTATIGAIISKVLADHVVVNLTDAVFPRIDKKDDKIRVSLPTYFKDMVHLIHDPIGYVTSSMSGWIGRVADLLRNKDYYGTQIRDTDDPITKQALAVGKYVGQTLLPFSVRGYKNLSDQEAASQKKLMALVGINPAPRRIGQSAAEKKSEDYWKGRATEAGIKPEQMESKAEKRRMVAQIQRGVTPNISAALAAGTIKGSDIKGLYQRASKGALASQVTHMPLVDAEKVFQRATLKERNELLPIMAKKRLNTAKRGRKMFTGF